jgi:hypothetical protein
MPKPSIAVVSPWQLPRLGSDKRVILYKDTCYARFIYGDACVYLNVCNTSTVQNKVIIISTTGFNISVFCFIATQWINSVSYDSQNRRQLFPEMKSQDRSA